MPRTSSPPINSRPSFLHTLKEGMAFGAGSSIGHRIVDMMIPQKPTPTLTRLEEYEQCMKKYEQVGGDDTVCEKILSKN